MKTEDLFERIKPISDDEPGVITLDKTKTAGKEIKIYFGRQKERGRFVHYFLH